jgi:hypothetical protein
MSIVRVGATKQYSDNWENIFSGRKSHSAKSATAVATKSANGVKKKPAKKKAAKAVRKKSRRK